MCRSLNYYVEYQVLKRASQLIGLSLQPSRGGKNLFKKKILFTFLLISLLVVSGCGTEEKTKEANQTAAEDAAQVVAEQNKDKIVADKKWGSHEVEFNGKKVSIEKYINPQEGYSFLFPEGWITGYEYFDNGITIKTNSDMDFSISSRELPATQIETEIQWWGQKGDIKNIFANNGDSIYLLNYSNAEYSYFNGYVYKNEKEYSFNSGSNKAMVVQENKDLLTYIMKSFEVDGTPSYKNTEALAQQNKNSDDIEKDKKMQAFYNQLLASNEPVKMSQIIKKENDIYTEDITIDMTNLYSAARWVLWGFSYGDKELLSTCLFDPKNEFSKISSIIGDFPNTAYQHFGEFEMKVTGNNRVFVLYEREGADFTLVFDKIGGKYYFDRVQ